MENSFDEKYNKIYKFNNFISLLGEGLINTYPIKTTIKLILREIGHLKIQAKVDSDDETSTIFVKGYSKTFLNKDIKNLIRMITTCGYFPSTFGLYNKKDVLVSYINYSDFNSDDELESFFRELNRNIENSFYTEIIIESKFNSIVKNIPDKLYDDPDFSGNGCVGS